MAHWTLTVTTPEDVAKHHAEHHDLDEAFAWADAFVPAHDPRGGIAMLCLSRSADGRAWRREENEPRWVPVVVGGVSAYDWFFELHSISVWKNVWGCEWPSAASSPEARATGESPGTLKAR